MTFNETNVTATCCKLDGTPVSVTCGRGYSCAASCFSEEAALCPSENCESCEDLEEVPQERGRSYVIQASSKLSHCTRNGCKVKGRFKGCCFHPRCAKRRQTQCSWLNYLVGGFEFATYKDAEVKMCFIQATSVLGLVSFQMVAGCVRNKRYQFQKQPT